MFNLKKKIKSAKESERKDVQIIATYIEHKDYDMENQDQYNHAFKRNVRTAQRLSCYKLEDIKKTMEWLDDNSDGYIWKLETIEKFVLEVRQMEKEEKEKKRRTPVYDDDGTLLWFK